jgi:hypothetical protein
MVAAARLLQLLQVAIQILRRVERRPVDARQLRVVLVPAPVGAGEPRQLDRLDRLRVLQVGSAAEVGEVALRVDGDRGFGVVDELDLVILALLGEVALCLLRGDLASLPRAPFRELAPDLLLDAFEGVLRDRLGELEVVVEAVLDRRPDRDLDPGVEATHGLRQQVRGGVPQHGERVRIVLVACGQDLDLLAVLERQAHVLHPPVHAHEHGVLGQLRADGGGRVEPARALRKFQFRRVGKDHLHGKREY